METMGTKEQVRTSNRPGWLSSFSTTGQTQKRYSRTRGTSRWVRLAKEASGSSGVCSVLGSPQTKSNWRARRGLEKKTGPWSERAARRTRVWDSSLQAPHASRRKKCLELKEYLVLSPPRKKKSVLDSVQQRESTPPIQPLEEKQYFCDLKPHCDKLLVLLLCTFLENRCI